VVGGNDLITGGIGADKFNINFLFSDSELATQARILDYQQGVDSLILPAFASGIGKKFVFNNGDAALGALALGTVLGNGGDGLHDVLYSTEDRPPV
jgi:hypothetical protein